MKLEPFENGARVWAPAKINLFFEILFKRPDNYHEIETIIAPISIYDEIKLKILPRNEKSIFECFDENGAAIPDIPLDETNLVWRAANVFFDEIGEKFPLSIKILKKIPSKAGLGGGSSDAAAVLSVLNALRGAPLSKARLQKLGARLGSDVPLFFEDGASLGRGRGELVEPFDLPEIWLVVVKPRDGLSTPAVFRRYAEHPATEKRSLTERVATLERAKTALFASETPSTPENSARFAAVVASTLANRLEDVAATIWPGVEKYRALLSATTDVLGVQMSGSGTAFFALYPSESAARRAADELRANATDGETVFVAKTISFPPQPPQNKFPQQNEQPPQNAQPSQDG